MSNQKLIDDIFEKILKKDRLEKFKQRAQNGDGFAQFILGEIYFYGINADDEYWRDIDKAVALMQYSKKDNFSYGFTCFCNKQPDYKEALKWYKMAAANGNAEAKNKIEKIETGVQASCTGVMTYFCREENKNAKK